MSLSDEHGGDKPIEEGTSTRYPARGCSHCPAAFFKSEGLAKHINEKHADEPAPESWESSPEHVVSYHPNLTRQHPHFYLLSDKQSGKYISNLVVGDKGDIQGIETHPKMRRQGLATELLNAAKEHAEGTPGVPMPKHSSTRTGLGEKWAKSAASKLGGEVPKRQGSLLSPRQMQGMIGFD